MSVADREDVAADEAPRPWWFDWALARLATLALVFLSRRPVAGDPTYYLAELDRVSDHGWSDVLPEYPLPVAVAMWPLHVVADHGVAAWLVVAVTLLAIDLAFTTTLHRDGNVAGVRCWTWGILLMGPLALQRLDLLAGVLLGTSLLLGGSRARGAALVLGAATKIFPVVALPILVAGSARRLRLLGSIALVGLLVASIGLLVGGWERLVSPARYQSARGLQDESVAATPFMVLRVLDPDRWPTAWAASKSYELSGPGTGAALTLTHVASVAVLPVVLWLAVRLWSRTRDRADSSTASPASSSATCWCAIAAVCGVVVTSPVLSPQYLLWVLPVLAVAQRDPSGAWRRWTRGFMVALLLTQLLYPTLYGGLVEPMWATLPASAVLAARNAILVALSVEAVRQAVRATRTGRRPAPVPAT